MKQENAVPDRAATLVVHPTPGLGDATTIADALAMLVALGAGGGELLLREGTYALAATITLPDIPVSFKGCGDATVISLGGNAIAAFTVPTLTARRDYVFEDFLVTGTSIAGQEIWSIGDGDSRGVIFGRRINSSGVKDPVLITAGSGAPDFEPITINLDDCHFIPIANGTSILINSTPFIGITANVYLQRIRFYNIFLDTVAGALTGGGDFVDFTGINILGEDNLFAIGTTGTVGAINLTDSVIFNFTGGANPTIAVGDDNSGAIPSCMVGCECQFINFDLAGNGTDFIGGHYRACAFTDGAISTFTNCFMFTNPPGAATVILGTGDTYVIACRFDNIGTSFVLDGNFQTISGNFFDGAPGTAIIRTTNGSAEIADNRFLGIVVPILELTSSTNNIDNNRWATNPTLLAASDAIVNGFKRKNISGQATVDALTLIFTHQNDKGLAGAGAIKNTGANALTIRRTGTDAFGVTDFQEDNVLAGATLTWPMDTALGTALPSFTVFTVSVRSTTPGNPTTFDLRHASTGAY